MNENQNPGAVAPESVQPAQPAPAPIAQPAPQAPVQQSAPAAPAQVTPAPAPVDNGRTGQQFDKLTESNNQLYEANKLLREALAARAESNQQFAPINQQVPPAQPARQQYQQPQAPVQQPQAPVQMPKVTDFIETDPATGERYINQTKFETAVADINQRARRAEEVVNNYIYQAEQREIERQDREAWAAYPELNPRSTQFDARFSQQSRAIIYDSMINPQDYGGRALGFKEAADYLKGTPAPTNFVPQTQVPAMDPALAAQNQTAKEQASLAATPQPQQANQYVSQDDAYNRLVMGTRTGSDEALARRLLNAPHRIEDVEALQTR